MGRARRRKEKRPEKVLPAKVTTPSLHFGGEGLLARPLAGLLLLAFLATFIYSNTFSVPFHFDDTPNIVENPQIKDLKNFLDFYGSRYIGFLSFALNYHFGGLHVFGYHLVNLLIHIINGFLVYSLVLLLFKSSRRQKTPADPNILPTTHDSHIAAAPWIALAAAMLFVAHPIQTQAVTYIVQRFASLVTLFYLFTVVCYLKWRLASSETRSRFLWYGGAVLSTVLAMKTKENSFTLPFMILLVEAVFFRSFTKKRWVMLLPFLLTLMIIPISRGDALGEAEGFARHTTEISRSDYLFTQFRVIVTYIRLLFLPFRQNLDYDYPIYHSLLEPTVLLSFLFLLSLFGLSLYLLYHSPLTARNSQARLIAFGIGWFFLTLSIESSIIPIRDVIYEHRLYLPSVGFFMALSVGVMMGRKWLQRLRVPPAWGMVGLGAIVLLLSSATYQRNLVWQDEIALWQDVVAKAPQKARGHNNLGIAYKEKGRLEAALQEYEAAITLKPDYAKAHNNLGVVYKGLGRLEAAIEAYQQALALKPDYVESYYNLGIAYRDLGRLEAAIEAYQQALALKPDFAEAHSNLGVAYRDLGRPEAAIEAYQQALSLKPDFAEAHNNLGIAYRDLSRPEAAIEAYQQALAFKPDNAEAHNNLGTIYAAQGRWEAAIEAYQEALELDPDLIEAHYNLGNAYKDLGRPDAAIEAYQQALAIKPDYAEVYNNIGVIYAEQARFGEAVSAFESVVKINPRDVAAHTNLGNAYSLQGRVAEAKVELERALKIKPDYLAARQAIESLSR